MKAGEKIWKCNAILTSNALMMMDVDTKHLWEKKKKKTTKK